ncbi:MAG: hypothetical protein IKZ49_01095, partial [Alphaproteobacteria bacterium]|nr:hypothetical protein [Alphaproteobacteria bacterium]
LTSAIAMGFVCPAFAEPTNTENSFPSNGLMAEDTTYTNAATSTNMAGVYENEVNAVAEYENILYQIGAGQYLPGNSETPIDCDQNGYFCPGDSNGVYYSSSAQGLTQCPSGYGNSGTGASANTDCYRICTNADVAHSTGTMNGGYYYGDNNQCEPTGCENGWHVKPAVPDLTTAVGTGGGASIARVNSSGNFSEDGASYGAAFYGLSTSDHNSFAVNYGNNGIIHGHGRCSTQSGQGAWNFSTSQAQTPTTFSSLTDETGQEGAKYCYCNVDGYTSAGGTLQSLSSAWVFIGDSGDASACASNCTLSCASGLRDTRSRNLAFRAAVFGSVIGFQSGPATCEANTITINWTDASSADISANNAGTATYGEDVRTPVKATTKPGQRFKGWRFVAPAQVQVNNNQEEPEEDLGFGDLFG